MPRRPSARRQPRRKLARSPQSEVAVLGTSANWFRWLAGLFALALAVRIAVILELRGTPVFGVLMGDARQYDAWAQQIAGGQWMGTEVFYQTPLYPYLLGVLYTILGHHLLIARLVQAGLGATSCVLLCLAGARFFDRRAGLAAGVILALYAPAIFFDAVIQKSSLDLFLMTLTLALLGEFLARPDWRWIAAAGAAVAAFTINRENARVLYPVIVAWLTFGAWTAPAWTRLKWIGAFTLAAAVVLVPVGLRNYHVGGQFLISTSQLGPNFYIGNHDGAPGVYDSLVVDRGDAAFERADAERLAEAAAGRTLSLEQVSDYWLDRGLDFVRGHTGAWLSLLGRKLAMTFASAEVADTESVEAYADYAPVLRALLWLNFGVVLPLAVLGAWLTRRDWRRLWLLYASMAVLASAVALFYVMARYRYPLVPIAVLFAGAAVAALPDLFAGRSRAWVPGAIAASIVAVLANAWFRDTRDETYSNLGAELTRSHRAAEAVPLLEKAVSADPRYAPAHFNLAVALNDQGDKARALEEFTAAVDARPDYFEAQSSLALELGDLGRVQDALPHFEAAVRLRPESAEAVCNLGQALAEAGQPQPAIDRFRQALALRPDYARAHSGLGSVLQEEGRLPEAIREYEAALEANPDFAEAHSTLALALEATGDKAGALAHVLESQRLAPDSFGVQMNAGNVFDSLGRTADSIAAFEKALAIAQTSGRDSAVQEISRILTALRGRRLAA